jgi:hypothetical protein
LVSFEITYDGPASISKTEMLGSSVRRLAITLPAAPAIKYVIFYNVDVSEELTTNDDEIEGVGR